MKPKELYLGSCVQDLNVMAEKLDKSNSPKIYLKSMLKIVESAQKADQEGDQEKAYVLFMRYCSIFQLIIRSREYTVHKTYYDSMLNRDQIQAAMNRIEDLQKKLNTRFEEREAKQLLAKRDEERKKEVTARIDAAPGPPSPPPDLPPSPASPWLSPTVFVHQLRSPKPPLVFDLRPKADAEAFPLKAETVINLDPSALPQSATVRHISEALQADPAALARFERRAEAPRVVLLDEKSKPPLTGTLKRVKEALFDWDASQQLKEEPFLLEGGFENFFHLFPTFVANAQKYREVLKERDLKARSKDEDWTQHYLKTAIAASKAWLRNFEIHYPDLEERNRRKREEAMEAERKRHEEMMEAERKLQEAAMEAARKRREEALEAERQREEAMEAERRRQEAAMEAARKRRQAEAEAERGPMTSRLQSEKELNKEKQRQLNGEPTTPDRNLKPEKSTNPKPGKEPKSASENSARDSKTPDNTEATVSVGPQKSIEEKITVSSGAEKATKAKKTTPNSLSTNTETTDASKSAKEPKPGRLTQDLKPAPDGSEKSTTKETKPAAGGGAEKSAKESKKAHGSDKVAKESKVPPDEAEKSTKDADAGRVEREKSNEASLDQKGPEASKESTTDRPPSSKKATEGHKIAKKSILKGSPERKDPPKENRTDLRRPKPSEASQGDDRSAPMVNRALKPAHVNNHNEAKSATSAASTVVANEQRSSSPKQWAVKGGARIQAPQQQQHPQQQQQQPQPEAAGAAASSWERRVEVATGREYFVDLTTLETRWADGSSRPPQHPAPRVTKLPLKEEHWSSSSGTGTGSGSGGGSGARLKRSGSQPNLALSSRDESTTGSSSSTSYNSSRGAVGGESGASAGVATSSSGHRPLMPSRDSKPRNFGETDLSAFDSETLRLMYAEYGTTERGLTGLRNLGNSCYMNSVLQALSNTPCLVRYIVSNNYRSDINRNNPAGHGGEIADEFATLLRALWAGRYRIISPIKFKRTVGRKNSMFATNEQQDSQEFLLFLLDGLHEDFNSGEPRRGAPSPPAILEDEKAPLTERAREAWRWHERFNRSFVVSFFQGQFRSTVRCLTCNMTSTTFDVFMYLSLQIPSHSRCSLRDCISQFSKEERMAGSSQWHCPRCRQKRDAVKHLAIWRLPPYLLIHLKRFSFEQSLRAKMNTLVDFPLQDMQMEQQAGESRTYDLYAVSNHYGSMESGHYTAYCLNPGLWKWFKFDDDVVSPIGDHHIRSSAAYILFYATQRGGMGHNSWFE